jgi:hypothetical protein
MFHSEVEEWLYSIGLDELYPYFLQDGFTSLDSIRQMRQSDVDAIVDRKGLMNVLNEEIDRLNSSISGLGSAAAAPRAGSVYQDRASRAQSQFERAGSHFDRAGSYLESEYDYEPSESLIQRYENRGIPAVGFASRHLARRAKSKARKHRGASVGLGTRASAERYIPNSASQAYESMFLAKRAASVAAANARELENSSTLQALQERQRLREEERERRAKSGNNNNNNRKLIRFY